MSGVATDPIKAAQALEMSQIGFTQQVIADRTGINQRTVSDIVNGHGRWGEIVERPLFAKLRLEQQQHLEAGYRLAAAKLLERAFDEDKLAKASTYQLVISSGIALDKSRLLAGESTQNIAVSSVAEVKGLDTLCQLLSQSLLPIDVTPK